MASYYPQYQTSRTLPVNVQGKQPQIAYAQRQAAKSSGWSQMSTSPPEGADSPPSSGSLYSSNSSGSDDDSISGDEIGGQNARAPARLNRELQAQMSRGVNAKSRDWRDYTPSHRPATRDPARLDQELAYQAQMSGQLNAKNRELAALQAQALARLARSRAKIAEGTRAAQEVQRDLEYTQKKMTAMNMRAAAKYPAQYRAASKRHPRPVTPDESSSSSE